MGNQAGYLAGPGARPGGGIATLEADVPLLIDDTDPENPIILLDPESAPAATLIAPADILILQQGADVKYATVQQLAQCFAASYFVFGTGVAATDKTNIDAAVTAVAATSTAKRKIVLVNGFAAGASRLAAADYIEFDCSLATVTQTAAWTGGGFFNGTGMTITGGLWRYSAGATGELWDALVVNMPQLDSSWDAMAARALIVPRQTAAVYQVLSTSATPTIGYSNAVAAVNRSTVWLYGNWNTITIGGSGNYLFCTRAAGLVTFNTGSVRNFLQAESIEGSAASLAMGGSFNKIDSRTISGTSSVPGTFCTIQSDNIGDAMTATGAGLTLVAAALFTLNLNSGANYANVNIGTLSGTLSCANAVEPRITIGQMVAGSSLAHTLGTRAIASIGLNTTGTQTFNSTDGTLVQLTGTGDGVDVVIGATSDHTNWEVNLTGTNSAIDIAEGAIGNNVRVTSDNAPTFTTGGGDATYYNIVLWTNRDSTFLGQTRYVSVRKPNSIIRKVPATEIATLGAVTSGVIDLSETLPARAQPSGFRGFYNLGNAETGTGTLTVKVGTTTDDDAFLTEGSIKAANSIADARGTQITGAMDTTTTIRLTFTADVNLSNVAGAALGWVLVFEWA